MQPQVRDNSQVEPEVWEDPVHGDVSFRVLFSAARTPCSSMPVDAPRGRSVDQRLGFERRSSSSVGVASAPGGWLGRHRHTQPEVYHVIEGSGVVLLEGEEHPVAAGSAVFIPGDAEPGIRNTGGGPLRFLYAFATDSIEDVDYRFSDEG